MTFSNSSVLKSTRIHNKKKSTPPFKRNLTNAANIVELSWHVHGDQSWFRSQFSAPGTATRNHYISLMSIEM